MWSLCHPAIHILVHNHIHPKEPFNNLKWKEWNLRTQLNFDARQAGKFVIRAESMEASEAMKELRCDDLSLRIDRNKDERA